MPFFSEMTTKLTPFSKIAQFLQRIYTKCNVDFTWKMTLLPKVSLHKMTFRIKIKIIRQMKYFDENQHICKLTYPKTLNLFLSEFVTLLMYINLHTKSHIFLKIGIFCKKIITFSGSAYLMKKSTFLSIFFFFCTKLTFLHQNRYWQKHL